MHFTVNILTRSNPRILEVLEFHYRYWYCPGFVILLSLYSNVPQRVFKQRYPTFTATPAGLYSNMANDNVGCWLMSARVLSPGLGSGRQLSPGCVSSIPASRHNPCSGSSGSGTLSFSCLSRGEWAEDCDELGRRTRRARRRKGQVLMWVKVCWEGRK